MFWQYVNELLILHDRSHSNPQVFWAKASIKGAALKWLSSEIHHLVCLRWETIFGKPFGLQFIKSYNWGWESAYILESIVTNFKSINNGLKSEEPIKPEAPPILWSLVLKFLHFWCWNDIKSIASVYTHFHLKRKLAWVPKAIVLSGTSYTPVHLCATCIVCVMGWDSMVVSTPLNLYIVDSWNQKSLFVQSHARGTCMCVR